MAHIVWTILWSVKIDHLYPNSEPTFSRSMAPKVWSKIWPKPRTPYGVMKIPCDKKLTVIIWSHFSLQKIIWKLACAITNTSIFVEIQNKKIFGISRLTFARQFSLLRIQQSPLLKTQVLPKINLIISSKLSYFELIIN